MSCNTEPDQARPFFNGTLVHGTGTGTEKAGACRRKGTPGGSWIGVPESVPRLNTEPSHPMQLSATRPCANLRSALRFPLIRQEVVGMQALVDLVFVNRRLEVRFLSPAPT